MLHAGCTGLGARRPYGRVIELFASSRALAEHIRNVVAQRLFPARGLLACRHRNSSDRTCGGHGVRILLPHLLVVFAAGYVPLVIWAVSILITGLVTVAVFAWYASRLTGASVARQQRVMRWTTAASVGVGIAVAATGLVVAVLTGYWLILVPTWLFGLVHIAFTVRAWLRWARRSGISS